MSVVSVTPVTVNTVAPLNVVVMRSPIWKPSSTKLPRSLPLARVMTEPVTLTLPAKRWGRMWSIRPRNRLPTT